MQFSDIKLVPLDADANEIDGLVSLDANKTNVLVKTDNYDLQGLSVSFRVMVASHPDVRKIKHLNVFVNFSPILLEFDKSKLSVAPLTCGVKDLNWELSLTDLAGPQDW